MDFRGTTLSEKRPISKYDILSESIYTNSTSKIIKIENKLVVATG